MKRNLSIDLAKGLCMTWVVCFLHLSQYLSRPLFLWNHHWGFSITWASLGTFSLIAGFLLGKKYEIKDYNDIIHFYWKRILRILPLFFISSILLYLIGFNTLRKTIIGVVGLSSFVQHPPKTLWYISMMIFFYLITPFILNSKRWIISFFVLLLFIVYMYFFFLDIRFIFNLSLYLFGICIAKHDLSIREIYNRKIQIITILTYLIVLISTHYLNNIWYLRFSGYLGVPAIISISILLKKYLADKTILFISYISMSCYLFHRFTNYIVLVLFHPNPDSIATKAFLLIVIGIPICVLFSYYIQKIYDHFISKLYCSENFSHS